MQTKVKVFYRKGKGKTKNFESNIKEYSRNSFLVVDYDGHRLKFIQTEDGHFFCQFLDYQLWIEEFKSDKSFQLEEKGKTISSAKKSMSGLPRKIRENYPDKRRRSNFIPKK